MLRYHRRRTSSFCVMVLIANIAFQLAVFAVNFWGFIAITRNHRNNSEFLIFDFNKSHEAITRRSTKMNVEMNQMISNTPKTIQPTKIHARKSEMVIKNAHNAVGRRFPNKLLHVTSVERRTRTQTKKAKIDMVNDYQPWIDFKFVYPEVQPTIEGSKDYYLVVLVNSGAKGDVFRRRRAKIRDTWASKKTCENLNAANNAQLRDKKWILVFVVGKAGIEEDDKRNIEEAKEYNDMLIGDIDDNYLNNILKYYMGHFWASLLGTKYTLKTDDDVYVRIPKIIEYLVSRGSPPRFYGGNTFSRSPVLRTPGGKWSISKMYFGERVYPPFNRGAFILMSTDLSSSLFHYVHVRKPFHTDDAYVGVAMRDFKVKVVRISLLSIHNNMTSIIRSKKKCVILRNFIAYGHRIDPDTVQYLHGKLETICRDNIPRSRASFERNQLC